MVVKQERRWRREKQKRKAMMMSASSSKGANGERNGAYSPSSFSQPRPPPTQPQHSRAPTFKWGITFANIADFSRPAETISTPQQCAVTATGVIWSRFATQIVPVNYNLLTVNAFMAMTGMYQLSRKFGLIESAPAAAAGGAVAAVKEEVKKVSAA